MHIVEVIGTTALGLTAAILVALGNVNIALNAGLDLGQLLNAVIALLAAVIGLIPIHL